MSTSLRNSLAGEILPPMIDRLFSKTDVHLQSQLHQLIEENRTLGGPDHGFLFKGHFFTKLQGNARKTASRVPAHADLAPAATQWLREFELVEKEKLRLSSGLGMILRPCTTQQDVRDALSDTAKPFIGSAGQLSRTREPLWTVASNPLHFHQAEETLELLDYYIAQELIL